LLHEPAKIHATFDDPNLVSQAGLVRGSRRMRLTPVIAERLEGSCPLFCAEHACEWAVLPEFHGLRRSRGQGGENCVFAAVEDLLPLATDSAAARLRCMEKRRWHILPSRTWLGKPPEADRPAATRRRLRDAGRVGSSTGESARTRVVLVSYVVRRAAYRITLPRGRTLHVLGRQRMRVPGAEPMMTARAGVIS
jgi:hypothetical protein